jgi:phage tail-like protein
MQDYPPVAFHFGVSLLGPGPAPRGTPLDASFQEVSGIQVEFGNEEVVEGGQNQFVHRLPTRAKYANLVLKRGVVVMSSPLAAWVSRTLASYLTQPIQLRDLMVTLKNEQHDPLITWTFVNAYPVRWEVSPMNSMESSVLTETMELAYHYFERSVIDSRPRPPVAAPRAPSVADLQAGIAGLRKVQK